MKRRREDRLVRFVVKGLLALVAVVVRVGSPRAAAPAPLTEHVKAVYRGDKAEEKKNGSFQRRTPRG